MPLLGVRLDSTTHLLFKLLCVERQVSMTDVARELIEKWIAEQQNKKPDPEGEGEAS